MDESFKALEEALSLAETRGYIRTFLDEGQPMRLLIAQWLDQASAGHLWSYTTHLLSQFDVRPEYPSRFPEKVLNTGDRDKAEDCSVKATLIEPLSQRELEVLQLMALGKTNQEIALQLIVSVGTVKAHAANIFRKLDVANRTQAVAKARRLGILT